MRQNDVMEDGMRLAVVSTHPIQYYAPYFQELDDRDDIELRVFYNWKGSAGGDGAYDPGFEDDVQWDIPLLRGYDYTFVPNVALDPGTHHFWGLVNPELITQVRTWEPDAILVHGWNYASHLWGLLRFCNDTPLLFRGDSTLLDESPGPRRWARRYWLRWVYSHVDTALYVGTNNQSYYRAHGLDDDQLVWVPHAVDTNRFARVEGADQKARHWRRKIGIPDASPVILFAGKLEVKKAPDILVESFLHLRSEDAHLVIVGSGSMEDELRRRVGEHSRVHFLGFQNQSKMPVVYRLGDVFVLPSRGPGETWGLAVNEAMACGRIVVVSEKVGCAPDLVGEENGAVVPAEDVTALRDTLDNLLRDRESLLDMGQLSQERISDWTIEEAAARTEEAVRKTIDQS